MANNKKISELELLEQLNGNEEIPVAVDGKNYKVTTEQLRGSEGTGLPEGGETGQVLTKTEDGVEWGNIDFNNLPPIEGAIEKGVIPISDGEKTYAATPEQLNLMLQHKDLPYLDSISGKEEIAVVKNGISYLATLTQIRTVVLPGYTYEDIDTDRYAKQKGRIAQDGTLTTNGDRIEIPITNNNSVIFISVANVSNQDALKFTYFGFTNNTLTGVANNNKISFVGDKNVSPGPYLINKVNEVYSYFVPEDAKFLILNSIILISSGDYEIQWKVTFGELAIVNQINDLENRVASLEQSPSPASASVSREEFDTLKKELDSLKAQISPSVLGKETM